MATKAKTVRGDKEARQGGLDRDALLRLYRTMVEARRIDDQEIRLKRQNRIFFQISGAGHEAVQAAVADHLRPGSDWFFLYYRDRALALALGLTAHEQLLQAVGAESDPASAGRMMPAHWGKRSAHIVATSSPTGTQFLQAVGAAEAGWRARLVPELKDVVELLADDEVVLCSSGEGQTSQGEFWESLSSACNLKLPVVYLVEDNGYAISVPVEVNTPGGRISALVKDFPDLYVEEFDGTDLIASHEAAGRALRHARQRRGPALLHAHVVRPYSHSMSDDERHYRPEAELEADAEREPIRLLRRYLLEQKLAKETELKALDQQVATEVRDASDRAIAAPQPAAGTVMDHLFSATVDPCSAAFDTEATPAFQGNETTMVDLLNACLRDEMARDPRIVVFGEDVADCSREEYLQQGLVKGKGGVFKVTYGLQRAYGSARVFNSPLAEANIVGRAIGMALRGLRPVVEIQFLDYIWPAMMQIRDELATMRYRSAGAWSAPVVIRVSYGGYLRGGAIYHSQTGESIFAHTPGLRVVMPATALDANGLLRTAIRSEDPVLFLEHKHLYRQVYNKSRDPGPDFMIPFGKARLVREGRDISVLACGALVKRSLDAAAAAAEQGIDVEVVDLRSLSPLDMAAIAATVKKTGKVVVAYEDARSWGIGAEIAARVADELFPWLDGPVRRVASLDTWVAYAPRLEEAILPSANDVLRAVTELHRY